MSVDAALRQAEGVARDDAWINPEISRTEARWAVGDGVPELAAPRWLAHRSYLLWHYLSEGRPVVSGHAQISPAVLDRFAPKTPFVTVLRDPVDRWISYFEACRLGSIDPNIVPNSLSALTPGEQLEEVLASPTGRYIGSMAAIYLGGHRPYTDDDPHDSVERSLDNLKRFAVVGFVSDWAGFIDSCRDTLQLQVTIPHLNSTDELKSESNRGADELFTAEVRSRIATLCDADIEIYREAQRLFDRQADQAATPGSVAGVSREPVNESTTSTTP